jgi:hypothetical protein
MYVESDFLFALASPEDWLKKNVKVALESEEVNSSLTPHTEFLMYWYDEDDDAYTVDASTLVPNLLELVPIRPAENDNVLLVAVSFIKEYGTTTFDSVHAGNRARQA